MRLWGKMEGRVVEKFLPAGNPLRGCYECITPKNCFGHKNRAGAHILLDYNKVFPIFYLPSGDRLRLQTKL